MLWPWYLTRADMWGRQQSRLQKQHPCQSPFIHFCWQKYALYVKLQYLCKNLEVKGGRGLVYGRIQHCSYNALNNRWRKLSICALWQDMRKGTISHIFRIFILKHSSLWNDSSYTLDIWRDYFSIILLIDHIDYILCSLCDQHPATLAIKELGTCPLSERAEWTRQSYSKIAVLCLTLQLTAPDTRLAVASNIGSVK